MTTEQRKTASRLFTAIPLTQNAREYVASVRDGLAARIEGVRWVPDENLHVTLRFIGTCPDDRIPILEEWIGKAARHLPAILDIAGIGGFPSQGSARVIWIGAADRTGAAKRIYDTLDKGVERCGFEREARKYRPHITIGRSRRRPVSIDEEVTWPFSDVGVALEAEDIILYRSDLERAGARYTEILRAGARYAEQQ